MRSDGRLTQIKDVVLRGSYPQAMSSDHSPGLSTTSEQFDRFASSILPCGISDRAFARFRSLARFDGAATGKAPLAKTGEDQIVFVASGATKLVAHASHGREQIVAFHFAGDLVSVPARAAHAYTLVALQPCALVTFPAAAFMLAARAEAGLLNEVLQRALRALDRSREKSIILGRKSAQERVASFLATMAERIGAPQSGGCVLDLPMSRRDIADSLGLTIETVSRQFGELRDLGLLDTSGRSIVKLHDLAGLDARAGHLPVAA